MKYCMMNMMEKKAVVAYARTVTRYLCAETEKSSELPQCFACPRTKSKPGHRVGNVALLISTCNSGGTWFSLLGQDTNLTCLRSIVVLPVSISESVDITDLY
jgi:hypothetical protein